MKKFKPLPEPFADRDPAVWHEDLVGVLRRYPLSPEAFALRHRLPAPAGVVAALKDEARPVRDRLAAAAVLLRDRRR